MATNTIQLLMLVPMHISFESFLEPQHNSRNFKKANGIAYNSLSTDLPLGPISISAYLKKFIDVNVTLLDFNAEINAMSDFPYDSFLSAAKICYASQMLLQILSGSLTVQSIFP